MTSGGGGGQLVTESGKVWLNGQPFASVPLTVTVPEDAPVGVPPIVTVDPTTGVVGVIPAGSPETLNVNGAAPAVGVRTCVYGTPAVPLGRVAGERAIVGQQVNWVV